MAESSVINFNKVSVVRRHHVCKTVWTPFIGETLAVNRKEDNLHDRYTVSVYLNEYYWALSTVYISGFMVFPLAW